MHATTPAWLPRDLFPFESRYADLDGCTVHYVDEGTGPTILFLHGNPTWSFLYRNLILELRDSFRCIALDYPGFGLSWARDGYGYTAAEHSAAVERFVVELGLEEVTLAAQDWGGPIGLGAAVRQPGRFTRVVLGNTWAWPVNGVFHFEAFARAMGGPAGRLLPALADRPALFLWGGRDAALRAGVELPRLQALFPDHETVVLERAKHFFQEDAPEEASATIRRWMRARSRG